MRKYFYPLLMILLGVFSGMALDYCLLQEKGESQRFFPEILRRSPEIVRVELGGKLPMSLFTRREMNRFVSGLPLIATNEKMEEELDRLLTYGEDTTDKKLAIQMLFSHWVTIDPIAALEKANAIGSEFERKNYISDVVFAWLEKDKDAMLQYVREHKEIKNRHAIQDIIMKYITRHNLDDACEWFFEIPASLQIWRLEEFIGNFSKAHPERIHEFINRMEITDWNSFDIIVGKSRIGSLVGGWCAGDHQAALEWCNSLPDEWKEEALRAWIVERSKKNVKEATDVLSVLSRDAADSAVIAMSREIISTNDVDDIVAWIEDVQSMGLGKDLGELSNSTWGLAYIPPSKAIEIIEKLSKGDTKSKYIQGLFYLNKETDPKKISQLLNEIESEGMKQEAIRQLKWVHGEGAVKIMNWE